jgi:hypothetical protein
MKNKIIEFFRDATDEIIYGIRCLCGKPSPMKRFIIVLIAGSALGFASVFMLVSSIYNLGHSNGRKEIIPEINLMRQLNLKNDSINLLKQNLYEYEQQSDSKRK